MACTNLDWKDGKEGHIKLGRVKIPLNYFSCGVYYFDGYFNIIEFPKGMTIYHGSKYLHSSNVSHPIGKKFYSNPENHDEEEYDMTNLFRIPFNEELTKRMDQEPAWYSNTSGAQQYSGGSSLFVYKLKRPLKFLLLDNDLNIAKILSDESYHWPNECKALKSMFQLDDNTKIVFNKYTKQFQYNPPKNRLSLRKHDKVVGNFIQNNFKRYDGYASNVQIGQSLSFHLEFMVSKSMCVLERDFSNPLDWQHNEMYSNGYPTTPLHQYIQQLSKYVTPKIYEQSGNLLEHSVWSLLFSEQLLSDYDDYDIDHSLKKLIAGASFIQNMNIVFGNNVEIYGGKLLSEIQDGTNISESKFKEINGIFGIPDEKFIFLSYLFSQIKIFHECFVKKLEPEKYISIVKAIIPSNYGWDYFYSLVIISLSNVLATQPFPTHIKSHYFPEISNLPQLYPGPKIPKGELITYATNILNTIYGYPSIITPPADLNETDTSKLEHLQKQLKEKSLLLEKKLNEQPAKPLQSIKTTERLITDKLDRVIMDIQTLFMVQDNL